MRVAVFAVYLLFACALLLPTLVLAECGDGELEVGEECDDRNKVPGDGCNATCVIEPGWNCSITPCSPICGDGLIVISDECEDGNFDNGDGCSSLCRYEAGFEPYTPGARISCTIADSQAFDLCPGSRVHRGDIRDFSGSAAANGAGPLQADCLVCPTTNDGWYTYTPLTDGIISLTMWTNPALQCPHCWDSRMEMWEGCPGAGGVYRTCDDDNTAQLCQARGFNPEAVFGCWAAYGLYPIDDTTYDARLFNVFVEAGHTYYFRIGAYFYGTYCEPIDGPFWLEFSGPPCANPGPISPVCGDGHVLGAEQCDDGDVNDGDGCSAICEIESGFTCEGQPSVCQPPCGDGIVQIDPTTNEDLECEDGNFIDGDGCSSKCTVEKGWYLLSDDHFFSDSCSAPRTDLCPREFISGLLRSQTPSANFNLTTMSGCGRGGIQPTAADVWFRYRPADSGQMKMIVRVSRYCGDCVSGWDAVLEMWQGDSCPTTWSMPMFCADGGYCLNGLKRSLDEDEDEDDPIEQFMSLSNVFSESPRVLVGHMPDGEEILITPPTFTDDAEANREALVRHKSLVQQYASSNGERSNTARATCDQTLLEPLLVANVVAGEIYWIRVGSRDANLNAAGNPFTVWLQGPSCSVSGAPRFSTRCGDGLVRGTEECDDANPNEKDGCFTNCTVAPAFRCGGDPSVCSRCGDGQRIELSGEECDDGNQRSGDGCSSECIREAGYVCPLSGELCRAELCGDGIRAGLESCDDGNITPRDGCSPNCQVEVGWVCPNGTFCKAERCGDGRVAGVEVCDDGNTRDDDGCSAVCTIEFGYQCPIPGALCYAFACGDGVRAGREGCDDGNRVSDDGCDSFCTVEFGWYCGNDTLIERSNCSTRCGDALVAIQTEECDDGNNRDNDGCSARCKIETGVTCVGRLPSICLSTCGDGIVASSEGCDDGNRAFDDGCSPSCNPEVPTWRCLVRNFQSRCLPFTPAERVRVVLRVPINASTQGDINQRLVDEWFELLGVDDVFPFQFSRTETSARKRQQPDFLNVVLLVGTNEPHNESLSEEERLTQALASALALKSLVNSPNNLSPVTNAAVDEQQDPSEVGGGNDTVNPAAIAVPVIVGVCCLMLLLIIIALLFVRSRRNHYNELYAPPATSHTNAVKRLAEQIAEQGWQIDYHKLKIMNPPIGQGAFGTVNRARYEGADVAVKTFTSDEGAEDWAREVENMAKLHHPNVVQFIGACLNPQSIVSEFCHHGSLQDLYRKRPHELTPERQTRWVREMICGMAYLHSREPPIIHRDLKCGNLLLDAHWTLKVADFGISRTATDETMTKAAGTIRWTAPEILRSGTYDEMADVYSFAIVLWEIWAQATPYDNLRFDSHVDEYVCEGGRPNLESVMHMPPHVRKIMKLCWADNPRERPSFTSMLNSMDENEELDPEKLGTVMKEDLDRRDVAVAERRAAAAAAAATTDSTNRGRGPSGASATNPDGSSKGTKKGKKKDESNRGEKNKSNRGDKKGDSDGENGSKRGASTKGFFRRSAQGEGDF